MVAKKRGSIERLRATKAGYSQSDLVSILEEYDFEYIRDANHGMVYHHQGLHDAGLHREASIMIPKGKELRKVYAADVLRAIRAAVAHKRKGGNNDSG